MTTNQPSKSVFSKVAGALFLMVCIMLMNVQEAWADDSGECGVGVTYSYVSSTKTLTISKTGSGSSAGIMQNYDLSNTMHFTPWFYYREKIETVIINSGVKTIGEAAFQKCTRLSSVSIPNTVTSIGKKAFCECAGLPSIDIPSSVTSIGNEAFLACLSLTEITIPASVTSMGEKTFGSCTGLERVFLQSSTPPTIGANLFKSCGVLYSINVSPDVWGNYLTAEGWKEEGIKNLINPFEGYCGNLLTNSGKNLAWAFIDEDNDGSKETLYISGKKGTMAEYADVHEQPWKDIRDMIQKVVFSVDVTKIGSFAFCDCYNLTSVSFPEDEVLRYIGEQAFYCTGLRDFTIPATVWQIDDAAFSDNFSLKTITFAEGSELMTIGNYAFQGCPNVTSITIPPTVTIIGNAAFTECGFKSITIPASVTSMGRHVFSECWNLESVYIERYDVTSDSPITTIGKWAFEDCPSIPHIYVPINALEAYKTADRWNEFSSNIGIVLSDTKTNDLPSVVGNLVNVSLADRTLYKNGQWNTLCLPFSLNATELADSPLYGAIIKELDNSATGTSLSGGVLTLKFNTVTAIEAGKPYIIKWNYGEHIINPEFCDVTISAIEPTAVTTSEGKVSFVGQFSPFTIDESNRESIILLTTSNKLGYAMNDRTLRCMRAHFEINDATPVREFILDVDGETTALSLVNSEQRIVNSEVYDLQGRKLDKPTAKGIYVVNGRKVVIK